MLSTALVRPIAAHDSFAGAIKDQRARRRDNPPCQRPRQAHLRALLNRHSHRLPADIGPQPRQEHRHLPASLAAGCRCNGPARESDRRREPQPEPPPEQRPVDRHEQKRLNRNFRFEDAVSSPLLFASTIASAPKAAPACTPSRSSPWAARALCLQRFELVTNPLRLLRIRRQHGQRAAPHLPGRAEIRLRFSALLRAPARRVRAREPARDTPGKPASPAAVPYRTKDSSRANCGPRVDKLVALNPA